MRKENIYSKKVLEYFRSPKNLGTIKNPDGVGKAGNIVCGDLMWFHIKVGKNKKGEDVLKDVKFGTYGCAAAIASSSVVAEIAKRKTIKEAISLKKEDIQKVLGELPSHKIHCVILALDALFEAIYDYLSKKKLPVPPELQRRHERIKKEKELIKEKFGAKLE